MLRSTAIVLVVASTMIHAAPACAQEKKRPPNIIHILADDVGYDDFSCYGSKHISTPNIDKLAKNGIRFTSYYAPHPLCTPSRAAMLTGCYAPRVGLTRVLFPNDRQGISANEITIAALLRRLGYATGLIGKWHLGHHVEFLPTRHGFDMYLGIPYPNDHSPERMTFTEPKKSRGFPPIPLIRDEKVIEQPAQLATLPERFTAEAVGFIEKNKDRPFFLHLANIETHIPWLTTRQFHFKSKAGLYGDAVQCFDWTVGQVVAALDKHGLTDNTLIVISSDNGRLMTVSAELEGIYGHAAAVDPTLPTVLRGGKGQSRYEGGVRVPCVMHWPGKIPPGTVTSEMAAGFDLFATFALVAGGDVPRDRIIDGKDLRPLMFAEKRAKSPHKALYFYETYNLVAVREGDWKLVLPFGPKAKKGPKTAELYNLDSDLGEKNDRAREHPEIVQRLMMVVEAARADLGDDATGAKGKNRRPPGEVK
jgi:arylsulfatase A-like enzyme